MKRLQVAVAIIINDHDEVLIARRHSHQHQGDLWEFPGGKREKDETRLQALTREIHEEVNLDIIEADPMMQITHDYSDLQVELDVWLVSKFNGVAKGNEGQPLKWCPLATLDKAVFPVANAEIIERLQQKSDRLM